MRSALCCLSGTLAWVAALLRLLEARVWFRFREEPRMKRLGVVAALVFGLICFASPIVAARAAIDAQQLGARYDATSSNISFRVYSSRATRIEPHLYAGSYDATAAVSYTLAKDADNVWSVTVPVTDLAAAGVSGEVFYGYRAWGPNWPYVASWKPGSSAGFIADVDAAGNRFNPNKLLFDPY